MYSYSYWWLVIVTWAVIELESGGLVMRFVGGTWVCVSDAVAQGGAEEVSEITIIGWPIQIYSAVIIDPNTAATNGIVCIIYKQLSKVFFLPLYPAAYLTL